MAFDSDTRNKLARMVAKARQLLMEEFTQQFQETYGIQPDGAMVDVEKLTHLDDEQASTARLLRERISHLASGMVTEKKPLVAAIERTIREQAFTILNRFAALRMCEERGFIEECVRAGMQSKGFKVFESVAGPSLGETYDRYKTFLLCLFDEIAVDLGILFDRFSLYGLLFPRENALLELLNLLNSTDLEGIWSEDETIGWIYQYFNPPDERKAMRKASQAPRNSRELAVRNQFFTPRYVVEFLTDNTLGRIWYEMRKGNTRLKEECRYLVRRPNEVFLKAGEKAAPQEHNGRDLSHEELLKQPVYIEHRLKKDPRDIKILDPACGSGHFLLYAFDLLETIFKEGWEDSESPKSEATGHTLREDFEALDDLRRNIPKLIMEHNLHGIDIDPRAVQIAALALWLRAQKTWKRLGLKSVERPRITKSNIVTAEPMPGEEDMRQEFIDSLRPRVLGQLVEVVFDKMKLAGEAGSLLKIEEEIGEMIAEAKKQWLEAMNLRLFIRDPDLVIPKSDELTSFDVKEITDEEFWKQAEERILTALKEYAERAENGRLSRRRLFAEDAARGFAFVELCRKRFDVVLMNPPFGLGSKASEKYLNSKYVGSGSSEVCASFYSRVLEWLNGRGFFGAISSRTFFYLYSLKKWRCEEAFPLSTLHYWIDLGQGILDDAVNETAAYIVSKGRLKNHVSLFGMYHREHDKQAAIAAFVSNDSRNYARRLSDFEKLPDKPLCYWVSNSFVKNLDHFKIFGVDIADVQMGLAPRDEFRFSRLWWEVDLSDIGVQREWLPYAKGGELSPYYSDVELLLRARGDLAEIKASLNQKYPYLNGNLDWVLHPENHYFEPGLTFGQRTTFLRVSVLPKGGYFSVAGKGIFGRSVSNRALLQLINTPAAQYLISLRREFLEINPQYQEGDVARMPWPEVPIEDIRMFEDTGRENTACARSIAACDEVDHSFSRFVDPEEFRERLERCKEVIKENEEKADASFSSLLGLSIQDREFINSEILQRWDLRSTANWYEPQKVDRLQYVMGCIFGRWDVRIALDPSLAPKLPDPFDPLPVCPPGMLVGPDGLPAKSGGIVSEEWLRARPDANKLPLEGSVSRPTIQDSEYPLRISWDGILVDDPGHEEDIVRRTREVLDVLWSDRAQEIEQEACEILGVCELRDYFRKPSGFFQDHLKRYSKSRRKAPIYWPLSTSSGSYTLWIYYHRLTDQTLYACVNDYVNPKLEDVSKDIEILQKEVAKQPTAQNRQRLEQLMDLEQELKDFRDELLRVATLPYKPDLSDGVMITASPLWKLFQHKQWRKTLESCWKKLEAGDYDWAHLAYAIWPGRVKEKCKIDRSIAIAHYMENLYQGDVNKAKKRKKRAKG